MKFLLITLVLGLVAASTLAAPLDVEDAGVDAPEELNRAKKSIEDVSLFFRKNKNNF